MVTQPKNHNHLTDLASKINFNMPFQKLLILISWITISLSAAKELPTSLKEIPAQENLPDLFKFNDGSDVKSLEEWKKRRKELVEPLMFYQYGSMPPRPDKIAIESIKKRITPAE